MQKTLGVEKRPSADVVFRATSAVAARGWFVPGLSGVVELTGTLLHAEEDLVHLKVGFS